MASFFDNLGGKLSDFGKSVSDMVKTYRRMANLKNAFGGAESAEKMTFELNDALTNLANVKSMILERVKAERAKSEQGS